MKIKSKNKGITLIALVITIIVMLILVGVSISMAVNGGLFSYAGKAVRDTENELEKEKDIVKGKIQIGNEIYNSIDEYLYGKPIEGHDGEMFSPIYEKTTKITQKEGDKTYTAWIPKGFSVGTSDGINKISTGLVIRDEEGNEFVWIPVEKAIITESEIETLKTKYAVETDTDAVAKLANEEGIYPMAVGVIEKDDENKEITNYKGMLYEFSGTDTLTVTVCDWTRTSHTEPTNLLEEYDNTTNLGADWNEETFQKAYNSMVKSVANNGGFYVGRYEISSGTYTLEAEDTITYAQSQPDKDAMVSTTWYDMYKYESNYTKYNESLGVTSEMIWGSQWDQMMIFVNGKDDGAENPAPFYVTTTGNRKSGDTSTKTGANKVDQVANIFDLEASRYEWIQKAEGSFDRSTRGGFCDEGLYASYDDFGDPSLSSVYLSSRLALYIK